MYLSTVAYTFLHLPLYAVSAHVYVPSHVVSDSQPFLESAKQHSGSTEAAVLKLPSGNSIFIAHI